MLRLKILLPYKTALDIDNVEEVVVETNKGSFGILPRRLDCVASLVPGILQYKIKNETVRSIAVDRGSMTKKGNLIVVSVHNAIVGKGLGELKSAVEKEFKKISEEEKSLRITVAKLESQFIKNFRKLRLNTP